jgi:hypothetical protein
MSTQGCCQQLVATTEALESLYDDVQYLWTQSSGNDTIQIYDEPPSGLDFLRNHVAVSRPCIIRNAIKNDTNGQPLHLTLDDLLEWQPHLTLNVDVTPDGHGDCLRRVDTSTQCDERNKSNNESKSDKTNEISTKEIFVKPMEVEMSIDEFVRRLREGRKHHHRDKAIEWESSSRSVSMGIKNRVFPSSKDNHVGDDRRKPSFADSISSTCAFLDDSVLYYSRQNDCLRQALPTLWNMRIPNGKDDGSFVFPRSFGWAEQAFFGNNENRKKGPDAVNLWIGDERAVSAIHKDHYENLFYVLSGEKIFSLCPPADAPFLYEKEVISGRFQVEDKCETPCWNVVLDSHGEMEDEKETLATIHWIQADPFNKDHHNINFPMTKYTHPMPNVSVRAGELLYLPSLWFHRVTQTCETIGVNYWYDMTFESPLWCYFHFLQQLQPASSNIIGT